MGCGANVTTVNETGGTGYGNTDTQFVDRCGGGRQCELDWTAFHYDLFNSSDCDQWKIVVPNGDCGWHNRRCGGLIPGSGPQLQGDFRITVIGVVVKGWYFECFRLLPGGKGPDGNTGDTVVKVPAAAGHVDIDLQIHR